MQPSTILLTHAHNDHVGDTVDLAKWNDAKVICTVELADLAGVAGRARRGERQPRRDHRLQRRHGQVHPGLAQLVLLGRPESGGATASRPGSIVRFGGRTFYFAGDTALFGDMRLIGDEGIDVAILPIGDHFTMGPDDAARAAEFVGAKTVIPCHYNTFPPIRQDPEAFRAKVATASAGDGGRHPRPRRIVRGVVTGDG